MFLSSRYSTQQLRNHNKQVYLSAMSADPELTLQRQTAQDPSGLHGALDESVIRSISSVGFYRVGGWYLLPFLFQLGSCGGSTCLGN